ncbi:MAG: DegV family protein, partial [Clostridiales bacterium]|nr:DegV family protein [Clostridiales bacterium]
MRNFILSCCSTVDLSLEHLKNRDIHYVPFHFMLGDQQYADDLGASISYKDFYRAMREGKDTKTSQVNVDEFTRYFEPFLKEGKDILHV